MRGRPAALLLLAVTIGCTPPHLGATPIPAGPIPNATLQAMSLEASDYPGLTICAEGSPSAIVGDLERREVGGESDTQYQWQQAQRHHALQSWRVFMSNVPTQWCEAWEGYPTPTIATTLVHVFPTRDDALGYVRDPLVAGQPPGGSQVNLHGTTLAFEQIQQGYDWSAWLVGRCTESLNINGGTDTEFLRVRDRLIAVETRACQ